MTEIESPTPKETIRKAAKPAAPTIDPVKFAVPEVFRALAEQGAEQAKQGYARLKTAAEEATDLVEDTYLQATRCATEFNLKVIEALRANVNAGFDYAQELIAVKSLSEAVELSSSHLRRQFDALTHQTKELAGLAQKVAAETAQPITAGVSKAFKAQ